MKNKKFIFLLVIIVLIVIIVVLINIPKKLFYNDSVIMSLPDYNKNDCYFYDESPHYTDYCKFYYNSNIEKSIKENEKFIKIDTSNINDALEYFDSYSKMVKETDFYQKYDFDISQISVNDYIYIVDKSFDNDSLKKFDYYNVYYYDISKNIVYYIHNNT